jgi:hypothetical protein
MHREDTDGSVLQPAIINMLKQLGIHCSVNAGNKGMLTIKRGELQYSSMLHEFIVINANLQHTITAWTHQLYECCIFVSSQLLLLLLLAGVVLTSYSAVVPASIT